jgi:hypothetical protein
MVSGSVNVEVTSERCADANGEECGVDDVGDKLLHGVAPGLKITV